jgi:hypothetical protein
VALGVVGAVRVHWLIGIYFAELGTVLLIFDFQPPHSMRLLT